MTFLKNTYFLLAGYRNSHLISEHKGHLRISGKEVILDDRDGRLYEHLCVDWFM